MPLISGYQVTYSSASDSFTTIQLFKPSNGKHYQVIEATPVVLQPVFPHTLDTSSSREPVLRMPSGRTVAMGEAIDLGLIKVLDANRRPDQGADGRITLDYSVPTDTDVAVSAVSKRLPKQVDHIGRGRIEGLDVHPNRPSFGPVPYLLPPVGASEAGDLVAPLDLVGAVQVKHDEPTVEEHSGPGSIPADVLNDAA